MTTTALPVAADTKTKSIKVKPTSVGLPLVTLNISGRTENKMAKKYKNTVHKNPFRENRPKKKIPWVLIGVISAFLALIIILSLTVDTLFGTRKFTLVSGGGFYDKRSELTYHMAPLCYQPVEIIKKDIFATFNDTDFYEIEGVSSEKMITTAYDGFYEIYYNKEYPLPSLFEMNITSAIICAVENSVIPIGMVEESGATGLLMLLKDESLYCEYPFDSINKESIRYIYFTSPDYPYIYYCVHYFKAADGTRYIHDSSYGRCVPIGELLIDKFN